ncbi:MAG: SDR family NAD(P)-dependent oxidoreductase [Patulibacter sp.]|nr:SDR family NAD(P)-dependent oxidoreductase [Patulibacter sp.]
MSTTAQLQTPYGDTTTAEQVLDGVDLTGRRAIVTGGASGIGVETARSLAAHGAAVTIAVRDTAAGDATKQEIESSGAAGAVDVRPLDLADLHSVAAFVAGWDGPLDLLINNAGVMALPERVLTPRGQELHLATNHLGHFALATGLHAALAASGSARVVSLSSSAHLQSPFLFDDPSFAFIPYTPFLGYGQSKSANALFAVEADRRWAADGIRTFSVMPGGIATRLQRHVDPEVLAAARREAGADGQMKTIEQGAATSVFAATSTLLDGLGGLYLEDCGQAHVVTKRADSDGRHGVAAYALDPANAERLWAWSEAAIA